MWRQSNRDFVSPKRRQNNLDALDIPADGSLLQHHDMYDRGSPNTEMQFSVSRTPIKRLSFAGTTGPKKPVALHRLDPCGRRGTP